MTKQHSVTEPSKSPRWFRRVGTASFRRWLQTDVNKWRLVLLVFIVCYASFLLGSGFMVIQWDEMSHLRGGQLLAQGRFGDYVSGYGYYPPLYDIVTSGYFKLFGISVDAGRFAAATFALLSVWLVFEFGNRTYGPKIGFVSAVLLGAMPGFFWASKFALLESSLVFFFTLTLFFFFSWIRTEKNTALVLSAVALGLGFLAKYQILVAGVVMIAGILFLCRDKLRARFSKFTILALAAILIVVPWLLIVGFGRGNDLIYAITAGGQDRIEYTQRFGPYSLPVFYLIEMTWPYNNTHPILLPLFILGLLGLGVWAYRRNTADKYFLLWFGVVYLFFTFLIPNKQWRYVVPLFPVLAISAASFLAFSFGKLQNAWKPIAAGITKKRLTKVAAGALVVFAVVSVAYGFYDGYQFAARYVIHVPIEEATNYVASHSAPNESIAVLCPNNSFNDDMVRFYLEANESRHNVVWQYPTLAVDSFTPDFNATTLVSSCEKQNTRYLLLYELGQTTPFFNTTLTTAQVWDAMNATGRFNYVTYFGVSPRSIYVLSFS
jgi:4-amino-4-deoxy-L-arabinose transferase-like glycosyltransferase